MTDTSRDATPHVAICGPSQLVKIDDGHSVHVRTAAEWLELARQDLSVRSASARGDAWCEKCHVYHDKELGESCPLGDKGERLKPINNALTRLIDRMHTAVIDTDASGRPIADLFNIWWDLKVHLESLVVSATQGSDYKALYHELLFSVGQKWPDETRHQTALRYIQQAERGSNDSVASASTRSEK